MHEIEYGTVYEKPVDRADKVALQAAWDLCFARARWHAKSNGVTITDGPYFHINTAPVPNDQWWTRPFDSVYTMVGWSYKGVRND